MRGPAYLIVADPSRISSELGWQPRHSFEAGLEVTVRWYLEQHDWCSQVRDRAGYGGGRLGAGDGRGELIQA